MTELTDKDDLLEESGYRYHSVRQLYFNRARRQALSLEYVEDHSLEELREVVNKQSDSNGWTFHFNEAPSDRVRRELSELLG